MPEFPAERFIEAGASPAEISQLQIEFERSDLSAQTSMAAYFASVSSAMLTDYLDTLREAKHLPASEPEAEEGSESMAAVPSSGSTKSAPKPRRRASTKETKGAEDGAPPED